MAAEFPHAKISIIELVRERKPTKKTVNELDDTQLRGIGKIIAIASGKGGVGKSTVSVNLAVALSLKGYRVGLVDADVYGPSIPKMTGTEGQVPYMDEEKDLIVPLEKWGIKLLSIGHLVAPEQALIWRGPMASNAMKQIVMQVDWGELDYLLIDLPHWSRTWPGSPPRSIPKRSTTSSARTAAGRWRRNSIYLFWAAFPSTCPLRRAETPAGPQRSPTVRMPRPSLLSQISCSCQILKH